MTSDAPTAADGETGPPVQSSAAAEPAATAQPSRRTAIVLIVGLLVLGVAMVGAEQMLSSGESTEEGAGLSGPQACDPSPGGDEVGLGGLEIPEGPDAIAPGVLCAFEDDTSVDVASFLGAEPVVLNFWATWCEPCRAEMPDFQRVHDAADGSFRLVGINHQDAPGLARDFAADLGITYEMVRDPSGRYLPANGGFGMPTTLFVRPDGTIVYRQTGPMDETQFADLLATHLDVEVTVDGA